MRRNNGFVGGCINKEQKEILERQGSSEIGTQMMSEGKYIKINFVRKATESLSGVDIIKGCQPINNLSSSRMRLMTKRTRMQVPLVEDLTPSGQLLF